MPPKKRSQPAAAPSAPLPALPTVAEVQDRLGQIFPEAFPDRAVLVGTMAARVVFVFLYGGFIDGTGRYLRPSFIYFFTGEQAAKASDAERQAWLAVASKPGFRPEGTRWYADNTREPIRDDLLRNALLARGFAHKLPGVATTASTPAWSLDPAFAALFDPALTDSALAAAIDQWQQRALDRATLQRMALRSSTSRAGDVFIEMPDGSRIRISAGPSADIAKGVIEDFARLHMQNPLVVWLSASDEKAHPSFVALAAKVGLQFDLGAELPDVILADLVDPTRFIFCEIVATDGPVTEARKQALLAIVAASNVPADCVEFLTAFEDREAAPFRRSFSTLARNSLVWFRTEPDILVSIEGDEPA